MTTINDLAREWNAQPEEVATFADLPREISHSDELPQETEAMIRQAWASAPDGPVDTAAEHRNADAVLDELADIVDRAGYDDEIHHDL